ncbi:DedA family protein [Ramlibacter sp. Leaf400]|uniref:DedA family protein n=1 Tax=Ramlibacter sp. Leaf400 TaxID=1736365 RepID=UPI0009EB45BD|nr:VTT domain-containing protein [Ramlibacter sp. Leaf400]
MSFMESMLAMLQALQGWPAYLLVFGLLVGSGFGLPINEDILLLVAAALTLRGVMEPVPLVAVAWCGVLCADGLIFHWGRRFGTQLLRHRLAARALPAARLHTMERAMQRWGPGVIFVVRFVPGLRTALLFAAGSMKIRYRHLFIFDGAAALIELPLLVWGVRYVGGRWQDIVASLQQWQGWLLPALAAAAVAVAAAVWWRRRARAR